MKTIEEFFVEVEEFHDDLESRSSKTIHTAEYEQKARSLYTEWKQVNISLAPFVSEDIINSMDEQFTNLLRESRKSRSNVKESANFLNMIEDTYIEHVYPKISHRNITAGFVNSPVTELDEIEDDKYKEYMTEAVQCVQADAYRGAVVLAWQAAMYSLYRKLEEQDEPIHVAYQKKFHTKPDIEINSFWDFQKMKDRNILILSESTGIIDKSLKDMLNREKDIRNKAAHPGVYDVGPNGTKTLLETVIQLLSVLDL